MKKRIIGMFLLLFAFCTVNAQNHENGQRLVRGVIMDRDSSTIISNAQFEINDQKYLVGESGEFMFWAGEGDVVGFTHVGYKPFYFKVTDTTSVNRFLMGVFLSPDTVQLSEIIVIPQCVSPSALSRNLPLKETTAQKVAQNNVDVATYTAKTKPVEVWDADMNQKFFMDRRAMKVVYKGFNMNPDEYVGVNYGYYIGADGGELQGHKRRVKKVKKDNYLSTAEINYLKQQYNEKLEADK